MVLQLPLAAFVVVGFVECAPIASGLGLDPGLHLASQCSPLPVHYFPPGSHRDCDCGGSQSEHWPGQTSLQSGGMTQSQAIHR